MIPPRRVPLHHRPFEHPIVNHAAAGRSEDEKKKAKTISRRYEEKCELETAPA